MVEDRLTIDVHLCLVIKNVKKPPFTRSELISAAKVFPHHDDEWDQEIKKLVDKGVLKIEEPVYSLTSEGEDYIDGVIAAEIFGKYILRSEQSPASAAYCERAYGKNLCQFNAADMDQLSTLIKALKLDQNSRVLDVGCGVGLITEYISDVTGASTVGIDYSVPLIERAQERTKSKAHRLTFALGNMNNLAGASEFDAILAIDTVYFAKDLVRTIGQLKALLKPQGRMGILYSEAVVGDEPMEKLKADGTKLAVALKDNGLQYETTDLTAADHEFWLRSKAVGDSLKEQFEAEGSSDLWSARMEEMKGLLSLIKEGKTARYLYCTNPE